MLDDVDAPDKPGHDDVSVDAAIFED